MDPRDVTPPVVPFLIVYQGVRWPRCLYDPELLCGERETAAAGTDSPAAAERVRRGWHVADFCECPSCPVRVELSLLVSHEKQAEAEGRRPL